MLMACAPSTAPALDGKALYEQHCLACHQADGGGVPNLQPPLIDSLAVSGPPETLAYWVLAGTPPGAGSSGGWANAMPGFTQLSDKEIAAILTYVRRDLSHREPVENAPVVPATVARIRAEVTAN